MPVSKKRKGHKQRAAVRANQLRHQKNVRKAEEEKKRQLFVEQLQAQIAQNNLNKPSEEEE